MSATKFDNISATTANAKIVTALPTTPGGYWGVAANDTGSTAWRGGELAFIKSSSYEGMLYLQTATSGQTASWLRLKETLETSTSTTSTSTSTSSSTSTSTSSSSTTTGA